MKDLRHIGHPTVPLTILSKCLRDLNYSCTYHEHYKIHWKQLYKLLTTSMQKLVDFPANLPHQYYCRCASTVECNTLRIIRQPTNHAHLFLTFYVYNIFCNFFKLNEYIYIYIFLPLSYNEYMKKRRKWYLVIRTKDHLIKPKELDSIIMLS